MKKQAKPAPKKPVPAKKKPPAIVAEPAGQSNKAREARRKRLEGEPM